MVTPRRSHLNHAAFFDLAGIGFCTFNCSSNSPLRTATISVSIIAGSLSSDGRR